MAVGLIAGLGLRRGAVAATITAGTFDLMVVGVDEEAMALAAGRAAELHGGIVVALAGEVRAELPLPLFGIASDAPLAESVAAARAVNDAIRDDLGSPFEQLVAAVGFVCLAGVPHLRMTRAGLVRVRDDGTREAVSLATATR
jgi:adenine deaminase